MGSQISFGSFGLQSPDKFHPELNPDTFHKNFGFVEDFQNKVPTHDLEILRIKDKTSDKKYVLKRIRFNEEEEMNSFKSSLDFAASFDSPYILKIEGYFIEKNIVRDTVISYLVNVILEDYENSLYEEMLIKKRTKSSFPFEDLLTMITCITQATEYLQAKDCNHGDIKPANIFVTSDQNYKLCYVGNYSVPILDSMCSNQMTCIQYASPLVRMNINSILLDLNETFKLRHDRFRSDVYSFGLVILQLLSENFCLRKMNGINSEKERSERISKLKKKFNPEILTIVEKMLTEDELKRPDFIELKSDMQYFIQKHYDDVIYRNIIFSNPLKKPDEVENHSTPSPVKTLEMQLFRDLSTKTYHYPELSFETDDVSRIYNGNKTPIIQEPAHLEVSTKRISRRSASEVKFYEKYHLEGIQKQLSYDLDMDGDQNPESAETSEAPFELFVDEMLIENPEQFIPFAPQIKKLVIKLDQRYMGEETEEKLIDFISNQSLLNNLVLNLPKMQLNDSFLEKLSNSILQSRSLATIFFEFRKNNISDIGLSYLSTALEQLHQLNNIGISLAWNKITSEGCKPLFETLAKLPNLFSLAINIADCKLNDRALLIIADSLKNMNSLESLVLFLYSNDFEQIEPFKVFIEALSYLRSLKSLSVDLSGNNFDESGGIYIIEFLKNKHVSKVNFELKDNKISQELILQISELSKNKAMDGS